MNKRSFACRCSLSVPLVALATAVFGWGASSGIAQESFYQGKTITVVIRGGPGGGNDFYGRLLARHLPEHLPGKPRTVANNISAGGGLAASNHMATRARRDGTEIALLDRALVVAQRIGGAGVRYDARELIALGNMASESYVWVIRGDHPVKSVTDLKAYDGTVRFSGTGAGTSAVQQIMLLEGDGFPVEVITGYDGTAERVLAVVRGDVQATNGTYGSLQTAIRDENLTIIGRFGRHPALSDVPDLREVLSSDKRALANLMAAPMEMGRPLYTAPQVPQERVQMLRAAVKDALTSPALLDEAERANQDIDWMSAEDIEQITDEIMNAPESVIEEFKTM